MKKLICLIIILFNINWDLYSQGCTAPNLIYPSNGSTISNLYPTLQWGGQSGNFLNQRLQVDINPQFFYPFIDEYLSQSATSYNITGGLQYNVLYYWRVGVNCYPGYYIYSSKYTFFTTLTGLNILSTEIPSAFALYQNYPNPFNPTTKIMFDIPPSPLERAGVRLIIYDILGREVTILVNEQLKPGTYEVEFDGSGFASGVYFYKLISNDYIESKRMILIK